MTFSKAPVTPNAAEGQRRLSGAPLLCVPDAAIADLQKMAVAEWLQSFNSVRGPMESLGII